MKRKEEKNSKVR